jgi:hypothetical protein
MQESSFVTFPDKGCSPLVITRPPGWWMTELVRVRRLTDHEGHRLQQIVGRETGSAVRLRRAMVILALAGGNTGPAIRPRRRAPGHDCSDGRLDGSSDPPAPATARPERR